MPIRRWHGWAAVCRRCGQPVDLDGEGALALESRATVKELLELPAYRTIEDAIESACCSVPCRAARKAGRGTL